MRLLRRSRTSSLLSATGASVLAAALLTATLLAAPVAAHVTVEPPATPESGGEGEVAPGLPPPDLPTTNVQGFSFDLESVLRADLNALDEEALVYQLVRTPPTAEQAQELADRLQIGGEVVEQGEDTFAVTGDGDLFMSTDLVQYISREPVGDGDLPTDDEAKSQARDFLRLAGMLPPDAGESQVVSRSEEAQRVVVLITPAEPDELLAAYPSISVSLGPGGVVLETAARWAQIERADLYQLVPPEEAWEQIERGQAFIDADLTGSDIEPGSEITGTVTYNDVSIAYTTAGPPGGEQYLEPVFVFRGRVRPEGQNETYSIRAYIPALANSGAPVGRVAGPERS